MLLKLLKPVIFFIPVAIAQLVLIPLLSVDNIIPNLVVVLIVYYTLLEGQLFGTLLGFILGALLDLISGGLLGGFMFSFTVAAFIAGYFYNENKLDINISSFFLAFIVFISGFINSFLYSYVTISGSNISSLFLLVEEGLLPGLYTALFSIPITLFSAKKGLR